jgi:hypothetical protein
VQHAGIANHSLRYVSTHGSDLRPTGIAVLCEFFRRWCGVSTTIDYAIA